MERGGMHCWLTKIHHFLVKMVHKGRGGQKCPKNCPHGLWMTPYSATQCGDKRWLNNGCFCLFLSSFYTFFNDTARFLLQCSIPLKNVAVSHKKVSELGIKCHIFSKEAYSKTLGGSNHLVFFKVF